MMVGIIGCMSKKGIAPTPGIDQRMLRLPPIGMDRNVLPPPREEPTAEKGEDDAKGTDGCGARRALTVKVL